jgi:hypothetical protein
VRMCPAVVPMTPVMAESVLRLHMPGK